MAFPMENNWISGAPDMAEMAKARHCRLKEIERKDQRSILTFVMEVMDTEGPVSISISFVR